MVLSCEYIKDKILIIGKRPELFPSDCKRSRFPCLWDIEAWKKRKGYYYWQCIFKYEDGYRDKNGNRLSNEDLGLFNNILDALYYVQLCEGHFNHWFGKTIKEGDLTTY